MFKKLLAAGVFLFALALPAHAQPETVTIEVFERLSCPHCQAEKEFLQELDAERTDVAVVFYDIEHDATGHRLWSDLTELEGLPKVTPTTVVANTIIQGFATADTTGARLVELIAKAKTLENPKTAAEIIAAGGLGNVETVADATCDDGLTQCAPAEDKFIVNAPFVGAIDVGSYSLGLMSVVLGFVDGFNPCAMWVLVTFLILLMQVGDKRKMWEMAGLFIIAEAVMYYLILNVWFTAWDFVGLDAVVTPLVGLLALGSGAYFIYEGWTSDGTCQVTTTGQKKKITDRIQKFVSSPLTLATAVGIISVALAVNIIEFACSIGVPQAFTKILEMNNLGWWGTQWYMFLYILFYMADDLVVFGLALYSFEKIGLTTKYSKWSNLVGGILMVLLGLILIFKRGWLVF